MIKSSAIRVKKHRDSLRKSGLRPIQIWVPDTRSRHFKAECRRQSKLLKKDPKEQEILDWIEKATDTQGWK